MDELDITIFSGEGLPEFVDRLGFTLMELGIKLRVKDFHDDSVTFGFKPAEPLDGENETKRDQ